MSQEIIKIQNLILLSIYAICENEYYLQKKYLTEILRPMHYKIHKEKDSNIMFKNI